MLTSLGPADCIPTYHRKCYKDVIVPPGKDKQMLSPCIPTVTKNIHVVIVYNPSLINAIKRLKILEREMNLSNLSFSKHITLPELYGCHKSISHICIVGGDGTINKVINDALVDLNGSLKTMPILSIFPAGTNNSVARAIGSDSVDVKTFVNSFKEGMVNQMDVGRIKNIYTDRCFISSLGWGRPVTNSISIRESRGTHHISKAKYWLHRFFNMFKYKNVSVYFDSVVDGINISGNFTEVTLNILRHMECLNWSPTSYADDGIMELIRVENANNRFYRDAKTGIHIYKNNIMVIRCKKLLLNSSILVVADGNLLNLTNPLEISVNHKEIRCVTFV